ncbi:MAG: hypothetical protein CMO01_10260 [Thalassobius sp.]|nr:hypothetical protein [Thalassovita sp.]|tara:strand:- start:202 stop:384 length:183 start_codon:yes stop_codon:yes gene_type:complete
MLIFNLKPDLKKLFSLKLTAIPNLHSWLKKSFYTPPVQLIAKKGDKTIAINQDIFTIISG